MGARRGAGRSAARGRAIRAEDCEKAACSTSAARGCSKWIAAVAPATRARPELASERRRPARRIVEGTARGVGRRLPVAAGQTRGAARHVRLPRRRRAVGTTTCEEVTRDRSVSVWGGSGLDGAREDLGLGVLLAVDLLVVLLLVVLLGILGVALLGGVLGVLGVLLGLIIFLCVLRRGLLLLRATRV
jgi:hypothetical protein